MSIRDISPDRLRDVVAQSTSYRDVLHELNYCTRGRSHYILKEVLLEHDISTSHFRHKAYFKKMPDSEYFVLGVERNGRSLRLRLLKDGHFENQCSICGIGPEWNKQPLVFQIDHINGDHSDNRIENLRFVCPNCQSQTDTYAGKRFKKDRKKCICGVEIHLQNKSGFCRKCCLIKLRKRKFDPSPEELVNAINTHNWEEVGRLYGVSSQAIRKRCKKLGLI